MHSPACAVLFCVCTVHWHTALTTAYSKLRLPAPSISSWACCRAEHVAEELWLGKGVLFSKFSSLPNWTQFFTSLYFVFPLFPPLHMYEFLHSFSQLLRMLLKMSRIYNDVFYSGIVIRLTRKKKKDVMLLKCLFCMAQYMVVSLWQTGYKHRHPRIYDALYYKPVLIHENVRVIFWDLAARETLVLAPRTGMCSNKQ